jgi:lysophospholipase L1-like esterase
MKKKVFLFSAAILVSFLIASYIQVPELKDNGSTDLASENQVSDYSINWWREDSSDIRFLKQNFCQTARSTVNGNLSRDYRVCLNRDGFRDRNYSVEKPENKTRIIALGDAVTFGIGVDNNETWPSHLEKDLKEKSSNGYQVLNFGFPFKSTKEEVIWFNRTARKYDPDIVVLQYMANDAQNISRVDELEKELVRNRSGSGGGDSVDARKQAIKIERQERKDMSIGKEMAVVEKYLLKLNKFSKEDDFDVLVFYHGTEASKRHLDYINRSVREKGWELTVSDLSKSSTFGDSFYLNSRGNRLLASDLSRELVRENYIRQ